MNIQRFFYIVIPFLLSVSVAQGQVNIEQIKQPAEGHHTHEGGSFHCGMCDTHLFSANEATKINDSQLHIHGIGTDDSKSAFHCLSCNSHLGYFNHKKGNYQVLNKNVGKKNTGKFHCLSCQMPLFDQEALDDSDGSDDSYTFFKRPIANDRIALEKRNKFYKVKGARIACRTCNGELGEINKNKSGGFGVRVNLDQLKKQKRNK